MTARWIRREPPATEDELAITSFPEASRPILRAIADAVAIPAEVLRAYVESSPLGGSYDTGGEEIGREAAALDPESGCLELRRPESGENGS